MKNNGELAALLKGEGLSRTELDCHSCHAQGLPNLFIATINFNLNGNHAIECPRCGHLHYRVIKDGLVTSERYNSDSAIHKVPRRDVWKSSDLPIVSSATSAFIRDRWLNLTRD